MDPVFASEEIMKVAEAAMELHGGNGALLDFGVGEFFIADACVVPLGKLARFMFIYHNWSYDLRGDLKSVAFERGVAGKGGMPPGFRKEEHGLERLRVHRIAGLIFGTFDSSTPEFEAYIGAEHVANIRRVCGRPLTILGTYSQLLH